MKKEEENTLYILEETRKLCERLMQTPHYKKMGSEGIFAIVQKARAVGVNPLDALNGGMYFVRGKVEMTSTMMNDLIRRKKHSITKDKNSDDKICILHGKRIDNGDTWCESFSIEDAQKAGIYQNQWIKYPKDMMFARALSRLARQLFPDVIKGCYVEQEISQALEARIESPEKIEELVEMTAHEIKEKVEENIELPNKEYLLEYLIFCKEKIKKPMGDVLNSWIENPEPFKSHYAKWVENKKRSTPTENKQK